MSGQLKDYQVLDVLCCGTFYKVKHKVTNDIYAWKAYNCSHFSTDAIENIIKDVKIIISLTSENLLRYYDTIFHPPSKTLYFVVEYNCWRSVQELIEECRDENSKRISESFLWHLLLELARVCKQVDDLQFAVVKKCINTANIFVNETVELRVNCFELTSAPLETEHLMQQIGNVLYALCYRMGVSEKVEEFHYSDDLRDIVVFLTDDKNSHLPADVVLYHPTVLGNLETHEAPKHLNDIFDTVDNRISTINECNYNKALELCKTSEHSSHNLNYSNSPVYINISPKRHSFKQIKSEITSPVSPTFAALALELPGFVPRSRKPYSTAMNIEPCPQKVSEATLGQQWMSRLVALRQREESLNKRERDLIVKEIINSPGVNPQLKVSEDHIKSPDAECDGITLPPVITQMHEKDNNWVSRRRHRRSGSVKSGIKKKTLSYEDLDSSLSADPGDESMIVTSTKFTAENMPKRKIFPNCSKKKVHFTSSNPFTESDESVTLTFYELGDIVKERSEQSNIASTAKIKKFKYLESPNGFCEKKVSQSSPSKQAKMNKTVLNDITNRNLKKTSTSDYAKSRCSLSSASLKKSSENKASIREAGLQTPPLDNKKSKRKSLLPFKTPFKFINSSKV